MHASPESIEWIEWITREKIEQKIFATWYNNLSSPPILYMIYNTAMYVLQSMYIIRSTFDNIASFSRLRLSTVSDDDDDIDNQQARR